VAQLGARLDGIEEVVGSNPIGSTKFNFCYQPIANNRFTARRPKFLALVASLRGTRLG
jgi:hypothetical protein